MPISSAPCCKSCGIALVSEQHYCLRCRDRAFSFSGGASCFLYEGFMSHTLLRYKNSGSMLLASFFADMLWERYKERFDGLPLVAAPSSPSGYKRRGFHHIARIVRILQRRYGIPAADLLSRRKSMPQKMLSYEQRIHNLQRKIHYKKRHSPPPQVLIVDDLFTSGSTLEICTQTLLQAGVERCYALTIAVL